MSANKPAHVAHRVEIRPARRRHGRPAAATTDGRSRNPVSVRRTVIAIVRVSRRDRLSKQCGHQNEDDDLFCGNCPAFLEYSGERIGGPEPELEEAAADSHPGLVTRLRHAISGTDLPPPTGGAPPAGASLSPPGSDAPSIARPTGSPAGGPPAPSRTGDERAAALVAKPDALQPPDARPSVTPRAPEAQRPQTPFPDQRSPNSPRAARSTPAISSAAGAVKATIPSATTAGDVAPPLAEATVARTRWFRRRPKRSKKVVAAGDRPGQPRFGSRRCGGRVVHVASSSGGSPTSNGSWPCSRSSGSESGSSCRAFATGSPTTRRTASTGPSASSAPKTKNIPVDPARITGSDAGSGRRGSQCRGRQHAHVLVGVDAAPASVSVGFVEPTDVEHVLVHPGQQEDGGKVVRPIPGHVRCCSASRAPMERSPR